MKRLIVVFAWLLLTACAPAAPAPDQIQTEVAAALAATQAAQPPMPTTAPTRPASATTPPTVTRTRAPSSTPQPTRTPAPTRTPRPGTFRHPAPVGTPLVVSDSSLAGESFVVTVLEVAAGDAANQLARANLDWTTYTKPIAQQEYLGVRVRLKLVSNAVNEVASLYTYWHMTLRYTEAGSDLWPADKIGLIAEGYPPLEAEAWVFFLVRSGTRPLLYFQPNLIIHEQFGERTSGAYFSLEAPAGGPAATLTRRPAGTAAAPLPTATPTQATGQYLGPLTLQASFLGAQPGENGQCRLSFYLDASGGYGVYSYYRDKDVESPQYKLADRYAGDYTAVLNWGAGGSGPLTFIVWSENPAGFGREALRAEANLWVDENMARCP